ncbi:MAG TPA: aminotransferase [Mogibacterium sp.]|nr:aminotransferase [Mogibacterium sp.]
MYIKPFAVEDWMNAYETGARFNIAETCVNSISVDELFRLTGEDKQAFLDEFCARRMTYGDIEGAPAFKNAICSLYKTVKPRNIIPTHGAAGANHHVFLSLLSPGDRIISIMPTYQQLYSIPESLGADLQILHLSHENNFLPDLEELRHLATPETKMICINNPNNPSGALMDKAMLKEIVEIASSVDAYLMCDEVYRHLTQEDVWSDSVVDLYKKGISVGSMSKVFSLAGLRLGWIVTHDQTAFDAMMSHRNYNLISCGQFDEALATVALENNDVLLKRNKAIVRENLNILDDWVASEPLLYYVKPKAGTTALVYYDFDIPSYDFCLDMYNRTGAFVTPGDCFEEPYSMRIGYACDRQVLLNGLAAVSEFISMCKEEV